MTKIGVISDSHGALANVRAASEALKECSYILHLGDHERDADEIGEKNGVHVITLAGNCDLFSQAPTESVFEVEGVRVLGVHGHREGVKNGLLHLSLKAEQAGARLVLFGHTHIKLYPVEWTRALARQKPRPRTMDSRQSASSPSCGQ